MRYTPNGQTNSGSDLSHAAAKSTSSAPATPPTGDTTTTVSHTSADTLSDTSTATATYSTSDASTAEATPDTSADLLSNKSTPKTVPATSQDPMPASKPVPDDYDAPLEIDTSRLLPTFAASLSTQPPMLASSTAMPVTFEPEAVAFADSSVSPVQDTPTLSYNSDSTLLPQGPEETTYDLSALQEPNTTFLKESLLAASESKGKGEQKLSCE